MTSSSNELRLAANTLFTSGDFPAARAKYDSAVAASTANSTDRLAALANLGLCLLRLDDAAAAMVTLTSALALDAACHTKPSVATKAAMRLMEAVEKSGGDTSRRRFAIAEARYWSSLPGGAVKGLRLPKAASKGAVMALLMAVGSAANAQGREKVGELLDRDDRVEAESCNPADGMNALKLAAQIAAQMPVSNAGEWGVRMTELLLASGAPPDARTRTDGQTALMVAANGADLPLCRFLLDAGARASASDRTGFTPLHTACVELRPRRHRAVVALLLERGADVNAVNAPGFTALAYAAQQSTAAAPTREELGSFLSVIELLLAAGASVLPRDALLGLSAFDFALQCEKALVVPSSASVADGAGAEGGATVEELEEEEATTGAEEVDDGGGAGGEGKKRVIVEWGVEKSIPAAAAGEEDEVAEEEEGSSSGAGSTPPLRPTYSSVSARLVAAAAEEGAAAVDSIAESRKIYELRTALFGSLIPAHNRGATLVEAAVARGESRAGRSSVVQSQLVCAEIVERWGNVAVGQLLAPATIQSNVLARTWATVEATALPRVLSTRWDDANVIGEEECGQLRALAASGAVAAAQKSVPTFLLVTPAPRGYGGRSVGYVPRHSHQVFLANVQKPLQETYACAIPNDAALDALVDLGKPIVEIGAGSGYWGALLRERGVDIVLYDAQPPTAEGANGFFGANFAGVEEGGAEVAAAHPERALLLVWPFSAEFADAFAGGAESVAAAWDAAALAAYAGDTVVHVGELSTTPGCMVTTSPAFKRKLPAGWELQRTVAIPNWPGAADVLTVWTRRAEE